MRRSAILVAAAALASLVPGVATAQGTGSGTVDTQYRAAQQEDDDGFPWGLLGLLGLAGLIPRKRRDDRDTVDRTGGGAAR